VILFAPTSHAIFHHIVRTTSGTNQIGFHDETPQNTGPRVIILHPLHKSTTISVISVVEVETHLSYSVSVQQTPWRPPTELPKNPRATQGKKKSKKPRKKEVSQSSTPELTRVDDYAQHLKKTRSLLPESVRYTIFLKM
jgi:hypothetical protein